MGLDSMTSKLSVEDANAFLKSAFDRDVDAGVIIMEDGRAVVRLEAGKEHLRPGGFISGPTQMALADRAAYMVVMTKLGVVPMTVTSNLNINFLRPCIGDVVIADGRLMKIGRTLAVIEVDVRAEGSDKTASHAVVTYALPKPE